MIETTLMLCGVFVSTFAVTFFTGRKVQGRLLKTCVFASLASIITSLAIINNNIITMRIALGSNLTIIGAGMLFFSQDIRRFHEKWNNIKMSGVIFVSAFATQLPLLGIYESFSGVFTAYQSTSVSLYYAYSFALLLIPIGMIGNVVTGELYRDYMHEAKARKSSVPLRTSENITRHASQPI